MGLNPLRPILVILVFAGTVLSAIPASAATITVNSSSDTLADDGLCTLREAVIAANSNTASGAMGGECAAGSASEAATIVLSAGTYTLSIAGTGENASAMGDLDVTAPLTITGVGVATTTIDAAGIDRAFDLTSTLSLTDLTIRGGSASGPDTIGEGGGVLVTGGTLTVTRTKFQDNFGNEGGGGSGGVMTLKTGSTATVLDSTFTGNYGRNCGGSICVYEGADLTVRRSTFTADQYTDYGGGIYNGGTATIENSTFSGNHASGSGGAIYSTGSTTITSSTIAGNMADSDGFSGGDGGGIEVAGGTVTLTNTLVAGNSVGGSGTGPDCSGTVTSAGNNLIGNSTACTIGSEMGSDKVGTGGSPIDPMLGALVANGGPTKTRALLSGSPAINTGACASLSTDQRGTPRPQGAACDIGAFEVYASAAVPLYVGTMSDQNNGGDCGNPDNADCSLRDAIVEANAEGDTNTIQVPSGTLSLSIPGMDEDAGATGDLDLGSDLTIMGAGLSFSIIDADHIDRVLHVLGGIVTISDVKIQDGGVLTGDQTCNGAGIHNVGGTVTVSNSQISSNTAGEGGGIYNASGSTITLDSGTLVSSNTAAKRGAGITNVGTMTINESTVATNTHVGGTSGDPPCAGTTSFGAGGIFNADGGDLTINDSEVSGNTAAFTGGGIYNYAPGTTLTVNRSTISGNSTTTVGGGIRNGNEGSVTITNSTLSGNSAVEGGGALQAFSGMVDLISSTLSGNTSTSGATALDHGPGTLNVGNSILDGSCSGTIVSQGHNLELGTSCGFTAETDQQNTDPMLAALTDNGGPTDTHALQAGSSAIDEGDCPSLLTDQRGINRPQGAGCDIGAFETTPPSSSITFPADAQLYNAATFAAGCADGTPNACGTALANPDGAALTTVDVLI